MHRRPARALAAPPLVILSRRRRVGCFRAQRQEQTVHGDHEDTHHEQSDHDAQGDEADEEHHHDDGGQHQGAYRQAKAAGSAPDTRSYATGVITHRVEPPEPPP